MTRTTWLALALVIACGSVLVAIRAVAHPAPVSRPRDAQTARPVRDLSRAVVASVEQHNRGNAAQDEAVRAAGWDFVDTAPPDARLLALDPSLLPEREDELRVQLSSTVAAPSAIPNLIAIANRSARPETRAAAVDALGRVASPAAQSALVGLLGDGGLPANDPARAQAAALIHPLALDDPFATDVARLLDAGGVSSAEKQQLAFTLALIGLRDDMTLPPTTLAGLSPTARTLLDQMTALARR